MVYGKTLDASLKHILKSQMLKFAINLTNKPPDIISNNIKLQMLIEDKIRNVSSIKQLLSSNMAVW
jgi:hypothetical protein